MQSINPATGEVLERFTQTSAEKVERILAAAHSAFLDQETMTAPALFCRPVDRPEAE